MTVGTPGGGWHQASGHENVDTSTLPVAEAPRNLGVVLFALVAGQICLHSSMAGLRMAAPLQALRDGHGSGEVGVLLGLFALAAMMLALPAGKLADRRGSRPPVLGAIAMACVGGLIVTVTQHFVAMCIAALLVGAAANVGMISMQRSAGRMVSTPAQLRRVYGWLGVAPAVANFVGPMCAGIFIDQLGFRAAFLAMGILPLLGLVAVRYLPRERHDGALHESHVDEGQPKARSRTWDLLASPAMRRLLLVNWLVSASWDVHGFLVPILGYQRGLSASAIGTVLGGFAVSVGVIRVVLPMLTDQFRQSRVLSIAMTMAGLVFIVYSFAGDAWTMGACSVLLGLALGGSQPIILSTLHEITPHNRHGESIALRSMTLNLSSTIMPLAFGAAGAALGAATLFWFMGGAVGAGAFVARRTEPHRSS